MPTIGDEITLALQTIGVVGVGVSPSAEDSALGLTVLNDWIDALVHERLVIPYVARTTWTLTTAASYTIGSGATINAVRPQSRSAIQSVGYIDTAQNPDAEYEVRLFTDDEFAAITQKAQTNSVPHGFYYRATETTGTLIPWPLHDGTGSLSGVIYSLATIAEFAALTDTFAPAHGYRRFFRTNLAVELCAFFEREPAQTLFKAATDSKAAVKLSQVAPLIRRPDPALTQGMGGQGWDINTDTRVR